VALLADLLGDEPRRQRMAEAMRRSGYPEAAAAVTSLLLELVRRT
jgi:UDP-N-acetylglucosamine:LPS N-acetylglucosamine transferase